jgi:archaellum component FlaC
VLWVLLVVVALIPLAERLRIGNWLDFTRKVDKLDREVSSTQKEVHEVASRLNAFIASQQSQQQSVQQFVLSLSTEEVAQAFANTILSTSRESHAAKLEEISSANEDTFFSKKMSPTDRMRFFFVSLADEVLSSATPLVRILYATMIARQEKKLPSGKQVLDKALISIIEELPHHIRETFAAPDGEIDAVGKGLLEHLQSIKSLAELVENVRKEKVEPPSVEEGQKLIADARIAVAYISGVISIWGTVVLVPEMRGPRFPRGHESSS